MHELSIALSIIEGATEELRRQGGGQVCAVHLKIGPLCGVVPEALLFSYELACEGTALEGSKLLIEEAPVVIYCAACQAGGSPVSVQCLHCARCGNTRCELVSGDELDLVALEIEEGVPV